MVVADGTDSLVLENVAECRSRRLLHPPDLLGPISATVLLPRWTRQNHHSADAAVRRRSVQPRGEGIAEFPGKACVIQEL